MSVNKTEKAMVSCRLIVAATLILLAPCLGQQVTLKFSYGPGKLIHDVLSNGHVSGSLVYSGTCKPRSPQNASVPSVHAPRDLGSPPEVLQGMFANDPKMRVTQDRDGIVRMTETDVPTDILDVRIHHISFDDSKDDSGPWGLSFRGPNMALPIILAAPEVEAFKKAHNIEPGFFFRAPGNALDSGLPIISGELNDVTVSQALDYILKASPGFWVYENCSFEDGSRSAHFWFY